MFDIKPHREAVLEVLKVSSNHYGTKVITLCRNGLEFKYHRWLHPFQGDWEVKELFTDDILKNLSKIIPKDSTVIDIGGQTGNMAVAYSLFANKVLSFEPNPATFEVLELNSNLNPNIIPFNYAISDEEGGLEFHYSDMGFCNGGFATRTEHGIGVTGHTVPIDIYAVNLEKFLQEESIDVGNISLIKVDAEGHDKDILKTLRNLITEHKPYLITEIYNGLTIPEIDDLISTVKSLGYSIYDEDKNNCDIENLGPEIQSSSDINPHSGHNLFCVYN